MSQGSLPSKTCLGLVVELEYGVHSKKVTRKTKSLLIQRDAVNNLVPIRRGPVSGRVTYEAEPQSLHGLVAGKRAR